jgi:hypothetical protein
LYTSDFLGLFFPGKQGRAESEAMPALLKLTGLSWRELIRAIWQGSVETNVTTESGSLAALLPTFSVMLFNPE